MKHFGLGAYQQFHISTERILRFSPYSSTFDSFQLFFPSIFQDPAIFNLPLAFYSCSFSSTCHVHVLIFPFNTFSSRSLSLCQSVYSLFQMYTLFVFSSKLLWLLFSCTRLVSCSFHSSFSVEFQWAASSEAFVSHGKTASHAQRKKGWWEGWLNGEDEYGMRGSKKKTINLNCC